MFYRILIFIFGLILATFGLIFNLLYFSLLDMGFTLDEYLDYIVSRPETYFFPIGLAIMLLIVFYKHKDRKVY